jgi:hypothetical protein
LNPVQSGRIFAWPLFDLAEGIPEWKSSIRTVSRQSLEGCTRLTNNERF